MENLKNHIYRIMLEGGQEIYPRETNYMTSQMQSCYLFDNWYLAVTASL